MRKNIETMNKRHSQEFERKKKQRSNVNRDVFDVVENLMIHLIVQKIVHHNIVLYQNQQSSFIRESIKIHKNFDDFRIRDRIKGLSKNKLANLNKK